MGIFKKFGMEWKKASTADKINFVLDILCGFGSAAIGGVLTKKLAPNLNKVERVCASITMSGLGMAAGNVASKAFTPYTEGIGKIVDAIKAKPDDDQKEEEDE